LRDPISHGADGALFGCPECLRRVTALGAAIALPMLGLLA